MFGSPRYTTTRRLILNVGQSISGGGMASQGDTTLLSSPPPPSCGIFLVLLVVVVVVIVHHPHVLSSRRGDDILHELVTPPRHVQGPETQGQKALGQFDIHGQGWNGQRPLLHPPGGGGREAGPFVRRERIAAAAIVVVPGIQKQGRSTLIRGVGHDMF